MLNAHLCHASRLGPGNLPPLQVKTRMQSLFSVDNPDEIYCKFTTLRNDLATGPHGIMISSPILRSSASSISSHQEGAKLVAYHTHLFKAGNPSTTIMYISLLALISEVLECQVHYALMDYPPTMDYSQPAVWVEAQYKRQFLPPECSVV